MITFFTFVMTDLGPHRTGSEPVVAELAKISADRS
jgi:hypothetical protein